MSKFHGKTALITGSISGIGLAIARSFASERLLSEHDVFKLIEAATP